MTDTEIPKRRVGSKLRGIIGQSPDDSRRRQKFRRWIWCAGDEALVAVNVTMARGPGQLPGSPPDDLKNFIEKNDESLRQQFAHYFVPSRFSASHVRTVLKAKDVATVARLPGVRFIGVSDPVSLVAPLPASQETSDEFIGERPEIPKDYWSSIGNRRVLLGFIDVDGFDFRHDVFLDDKGQTRFARIWDQTTVDQKGVPPSPAKRHGTEWSNFDYGHEFDAKAMNDAIEQTGMYAYWRAGLPTKELMSHGTHVASIAGGSIGVCPNAVLAGVVFPSDRVVNPDGMTTRDRGRGDSEKLRDAVRYLRQVAAELQLPLVVNISLGRNCGSHDGAASICRDIDALTSDTGCCVVIAAGNAGDSSGNMLADGRVHASGTVAKGGPLELGWQVLNRDSTDNEMEIWYDTHDRLDVTVVSPGADYVKLGPVEIDDSQELPRPDGTGIPDGTRVYVQHTSYDAGNGCNYAYIQLSPNEKAPNSVVTNGLWKVILSARNSSVDSGSFHAWIERDDAGQSHFESVDPSSFDNTKVNSLACGHNVIAVANWDQSNRRAHPTSSQGPTRDGRQKPDIAAPGTGIWGANGFPIQLDADLYPAPPATRRYACLTGTSMAAPYVAGVAALMLAINPTLTATQIRTIMVRSTPSGRWGKAEGFGRLSLEKCLKEAGRIGKLEDV